MLPDILQDKAVQYAAGTMPATERKSFEVLLQFHHELRAHATDLQEIAAAMALTDARAGTVPPASLKTRILRAVELPGTPDEPEGLVVTDADGLIQWVNPGFTAMCGYSLEELKGRKPGRLLQGPGTDPATVERIRTALQARRDCREQLVNYHKDGSPYRVDVSIAAIRDDAGEPLWFVAREWKLTA